MAEKRLGATMKAAQKFPKMKAVYNNEGCIGKVPSMKAGQKRLSENQGSDTIKKTKLSWKFY